jgi:hypothetical protein
VSTLAAIHDCHMMFGMNCRSFARLTLVVLAFMVAACSGPDRAGSYLSTAPPSASVALRQVDVNARCKQFAAVFDELVACQRSDGTLESFANRSTDWRVRYFVRNSEMPCDEAPTVEESYVFNMVVNDLNADTDLDADQRIAIRDAMFDGRIHCKT